MKNLFLITLLIFAINNVLAQREADAMYYGGCYNVAPCACGVPSQGTTYLYNKDSLVQVIDPACLPIRTFYSAACFANKNTGELLFACNGWRLINGDGNIVSHKLWFDFMPHPQDSPDTSTVSTTAGPLFLPHPGDSTKAYLFYGQSENYFLQNELFSADRFYTYALLDVPTKSIINRNNILLNDTSSISDMQACRHANGRDWWLIKPDIWSNKYFIGLLTPQGIEMNNITLQGVPSDLRVNTSSKFNIQGTKYIHYNGGLSRVIHEFDFDRCNGTLSNFVLHDISDSISPLDNTLASMNISPDGSKFYIQRNTSQSAGLVQGLFQVDLATDSMRLIERNGYCPQMTPNGKNILFPHGTLIAPNQWLTRVSEIENPNAHFNDLIIHYFKYTNPNSMKTVAPNNFAYMRLGADTLSICDSLSVITKRTKAQEPSGLVVFPNPASNVLHIEQQEQEQVKYKIINYYGQTVQQWQSAEPKQTLYFNNNHLSDGFYLLQATNSKGIIVQKKFVIQR
ncbi:MAG: T9SS type A sorting domain-containing protein [Bacteroidota bacterium]|jgi:hypothetical protein